MAQMLRTGTLYINDEITSEPMTQTSEEQSEALSLTDAWLNYSASPNKVDDCTICIKDSFDTAQNIMNAQGNGVFHVAEFSENNILTHNGEQINVVFDQNTNIYFGATEDKIIFNVKIEEDGDYQFNLFDSVDQSLEGDGSPTITLQFGLVGENEQGDETQDFVNINIKGMSAHFEHVSTEEDNAVDITSFLEGKDDVAESLDSFVVETEVVSSITNTVENHIGAFNNIAAIGDVETANSDVL